MLQKELASQISDNWLAMSTKSGGGIEGGGGNPTQESHQPNPGGGTRTWSSVLSRGITPAKDNNVLEVVLEKDNKGSFSVSEQDCCNLMRRLGLDQRPGVIAQEYKSVQMEGG